MPLTLSRDPRRGREQRVAGAQVSECRGILVAMNEAQATAGNGRLSAVESVRCLDCGAVYTKPAGGGTVESNPGCPECGYLGWLAAAVGFTPANGSSRSGVDRPRRRSA